MTKTKTMNDAMTDHLMQAFLVQSRMLPEFSFYKNVKVQSTILSK